MSNTLLALLTSGLLFAACSNNDSSTENISFDSSIVIKPASQMTDPSAVVQPVQNTIIEASPATTTPPTTSTINPTANTTTAPGMNPPHGQPGHRCDIAVGAPLNSAPAKTAAATAQPMVTATTTPAVAKTAAGMNPPHGQPGHRCDIAVGAPLNSPPAKIEVPKQTTETKTSEAVPVSLGSDTARKQ